MIDLQEVDNKRIFALTRVSSDNQTFQSQMNEINRFCSQNNIELLESNIVSEFNVSGFSTQMKDRKGLNYILDLVAKDLIDVLIIFNSDRISRQKHITEQFIFNLTYANVKIISCTEGQLNLNSDIDSLITSIKGWTSEYESRKTSARVRNGLLAKAKDKNKANFHGGKVLLGYRAVNKELVIDKELEPIIKKVFELYISNGCSKAIAYLKTKGITKCNQTLLALISNTTYKGYMQHDSKFYSDSDYNDINFYNSDLQIVSNETWNKANELRVARARNKGRNVKYDMRSNFLYEGLCFDNMGHKLTIQYDYRYATPRLFLQCRVCKKIKSQQQKNYAMSKLEPQLEKAIDKVLEFELDRDLLEQKYNSRKNVDLNELENELKLKKLELKKKNEGIKNGKNKLSILLSDNNNNLELIKLVSESIKNFELESLELENNIRELDKQVLELKNRNVDNNKKIEMFLKLKQVYNIATLEQKKQILNIIIDKIEISNDYQYNIKVYLRY